jgi:UDP-N-acetylglucosamine acyltransferase
MSLIHPTAIVEDGAAIGAEVSIGAFSVVGHGVTLEDRVSLDTHVVVRGRTTIGARTRVSPFAMLGGRAQDLSDKGEDTGLVIGPDCIIREHATVHRGTTRGRGTTTIGAHVFMMVGSHLAHDCVVGDHVILTNNAMAGGHAEIGDYTILGGLAAIQQRIRIGAHAFVGGVSGVTSDVVPFAMVIGNRAAVAGINVVGLKRRGFSAETIHALRGAYRLFFSGTGPRAERIDRVVERYGSVPAVIQFTDFVRASGDRPLSLPRTPGGEGDE